MFALVRCRRRDMFYTSKRRGEDGIGAIIDFLLTNARLVLGVGGVAVLGIATLAVKKVCCTLYATVR